MLVGTGLFWAVTGVVMSRSARRGVDFAAVRTVTGAVGAALAFAIVPDWSRAEAIPWRGLLPLAGVLAGAAALNCAGLLLVVRAMESGHNGRVWTIAQSAFAIPFVAGAILFAEPLGPARWAGAALCLGSVVLLSRLREADAPAGPRPEAGGRWALLAVAAFACLGVQQTLAVLPSHWRLAPGLAELRVPLMASFGMLAYGAVMVRRRAWPDRETLLLGGALAVGGVGSQWLFFRGLDALAEVRMLSLGCPVTVAACMIGFAVYSALRLRETFARRHALGLAGLLASLACFALTG